MNEEEPDEALTSMHLNAAVIAYIDDCEEYGVQLSLSDDEDLYINARMLLEVVMETHSVALSVGNEDFAKGATLVAQCIMNLARTVYSRESEVTVEDLFGSEDNE